MANPAPIQSVDTMGHVVHINPSPAKRKYKSNTGGKVLKVGGGNQNLKGTRNFEVGNKNRKKQMSAISIAKVSLTKNDCMNLKMRLRE